MAGSAPHLRTSFGATLAGYPSCSALESPQHQSQAAPQEWLGYKEAMAVFGVKRSNLYGRLSALVRTRELPGESKKWSRTDLERLVQQHIKAPDSLVVSPNDRGGVPGPRPPRRRRPVSTSPSPITFRYLT
jgi:hypothetical protein